MKKILIFSLNYYPKYVGGAEIAIKEISDRLGEEDYEFHLLCLRFDSLLPRFEKIGNVNVYRIGFAKKNAQIGDLKKFPLHLNKFLYQFYTVFFALRLHKRHKFDYLWAIMAHSCGVPAAIFKLFHKDIKYVLTLQEGDSPEDIERKMKLLWPLFKRAFTLADIVQPISGFLGQWAIRMGYRGKLIVVPNGFSMEALQTGESKNLEIAELKRKLGKKKDDIFLVSVSRLVHKNGIDDCIETLKYLPENVKLILVGDGPDREKLQKKAEALSLSRRVVFVGQVDRGETALYRRASDIFIRPSRSEGMGNSFVSAMASKIPVIATQEGGIADFLFDAERNPDKKTNGWAVDKNSPEQIAEAVKKILNDPPKTEAVVKNAYDLVMRDYNWDRIAEKMKEKIFIK